MLEKDSWDDVLEDLLFVGASSIAIVVLLITLPFRVVWLLYKDINKQLKKDEK